MIDLVAVFLVSCCCFRLLIGLCCLLFLFVLFDLAVAMELCWFVVCDLI